MKFRILCWLLIVALLAAGVYAADAWLQQRAIAEKTVRLHVVANSDSEADQAQKLRVRDAVLREVESLTAQCETAAQAREVLADSLGNLQNCAQELLRAEDSEYSVSVTLQTERFDTRVYDTFTLPAGSYPSLRVNIGQAQGKNWWCVVFPSLCTAATSREVEDSAQAGGFTDGQSELITGGQERYELKFKTLELLKRFADFLRR